MSIRTVRSEIEKKLLILILVFLITGGFVYMYNQPAAIQKKPPISDYLEHIDGYKNLGFIRLQEEHVKMLDLDDYIFANYAGPLGTVNLYIGYYYSANKAYASHSPMICYPSQGWKIDRKPVVKSMNVGEYKINYEEIITSFNQQKELVLYWYQTHTLTNTQVYKNKIDMGYNKLTKNDEQHAFVRVSVPFANSTYETARKAAMEFIRAFYPKFIQFIEGGSLDGR